MADIHKSLETLIGLEKIKVWSLIVTLFGDLDNASSQSLSGKQINNLLGHIGIKSEATRVALHRLKNENWIETSKSGRETIYRMSDRARRETKNVYADVYGSSIKYPEGWQLLVTPDHHDLKEAAAIVAVLKNVSLIPASSKIKNPEVLQTELTTQNIPGWFSEKIINPSILEIAQALNKATKLPMIETTNLNQVAKRLLILHHWRKLALRDSVWCYISLMEKSALAQCHKSVSTFLQATPKIEPSILAS